MKLEMLIARAKFYEKTQKAIAKNYLYLRLNLATGKKERQNQRHLKYSK